MLDNADRDPDYVARTGTERAVHDLLRAEHGRGAIVSKPISPTLNIPTPVPADYAAGIVAARKIACHARRLLLDYAAKARGEGRSWRELAEPLGIEVEEDRDPAVAAFEAVAGEPPQRFDRRWTSWRCGSCDQLVTDCGPYNGHPDDDETGHAEDCARHQDEVAAYVEWVNS